MTGDRINRAWSTARKLLCVRLDDMGGVLLSTPAIRALRQSLPGRRITLLASAAGAEVAAHVPEIDAAIAYEAPWMNAGRRLDPDLDVAVRARLAAEAFDGAVIFAARDRDPLPSALFCHLAGIPLRLGRGREKPYPLLTDWVPDSEPEGEMRNEVRRQLDLVAAVGARTDNEHLSFRVRLADLRQARAKLAAAGIDPDGSWIALHPGASAASRRYAPGRFVEAARRFARTAGRKVAVTGSAGERELVESICGAIGPFARSFAGRLSLGEFGALLSLAGLLVCNNTDAAHLAAAVGAPVVDLRQPGLERLSADEVVDAASALWRPGREGGRRTSRRAA